MHIYIILGIVIVAIFAYMTFRKVPVDSGQTLVLRPTLPAPGVQAATGTPPPSAPPPPPPGVPVRTTQAGMAAKSAAQRLLSPSGQLENIPVIGRPIAAVATRVTSIPGQVGQRVNSTLEHIPVVGKALAAPGQMLGGAVSKVTSWF